MCVGMDDVNFEIAEEVSVTSSSMWVHLTLPSENQLVCMFLDIYEICNKTATKYLLLKT